MPLERAKQMVEQVPGWELIEANVGAQHRPPNPLLTRRFRFKNFKEAIAFVNKVADLAEDQGHHPDIHISWNRVRLELTTHAINGLSDNDFIMAAKISRLGDRG